MKSVFYSLLVMALLTFTATGVSAQAASVKVKGVWVASTTGAPVLKRVMQQSTDNGVTWTNVVGCDNIAPTVLTCESPAMTTGPTFIHRINTVGEFGTVNGLPFTLITSAPGQTAITWTYSVTTP